MSFLRHTAWLSCLALLTGCAFWGKEDIPWYVGIAAPTHYEVWVTNFHLEKSGERSWRIPAGTKGCCWAGPNGPFGTGGPMDPFPNLIAVRWFSLAEQKYYFTFFRVPPDLQDRMRVPARTVTQQGEVRYLPRSDLILGLAPGGEVVVWMMSQISNAVEVMRVPAVEVEDDPADFSVITQRYLEQHGAYLEEHGIPLEGW